MIAAQCNNPSTRQRNTEWPDMLEDARDKIIKDTKSHIQRAPQHLNAFVVGEYKKLVRSEMGGWVGARMAFVGGRGWF